MTRLVLFAAVSLVILSACGDDDGGASPSPSAGGVEELLEDVLRVTFHEQIDFGGQVSEPSAVRALGETGDQRFIPVLVDVLRFPWLLTVETKRATLTSLAQLRGLEYDDLESHQLEGSWWLEWLRDHPEVEGPPGYGNWMGRLFGQLVDRRMADFFDTTGPEPEVRLEEIVRGGVPRDGIPDLRQPPHGAAGDAGYLNPDDRVFGLNAGWGEQGVSAANYECPRDGERRAGRGAVCAVVLHAVRQRHRLRDGHRRGSAVVRDIRSALPKQ